MELIGFTENNRAIFVKDNHATELERTYFVLFSKEPMTLLEVKNANQDFIHRPATWLEKEQHRKTERLKHIKEKELASRGLGEQVIGLLVNSLIKNLLYK